MGFLPYILLQNLGFACKFGELGIVLVYRDIFWEFVFVFGFFKMFVVRFMKLYFYKKGLLWLFIV